MANEPSEDFVSAVAAVVNAIPPGKVMTYGDVAAALGSRAARAVGTVMARYGHDLPWWRVIRASGHPVISHETEAMRHFAEEGTPVTGTRVNLRLARYQPWLED